VERNLRVLHVITRLIVGGAQENTLLTAIGQRNTPGIGVTLLCGIDEGPEGNLLDAARNAGVELHLMPELVRPISPLQDVTALIKLIAFIRRGRFDVVHTHSSKAGILGRLAAKATGTPIIVHTLHSLVFGEHATPRQNAVYLRAKRLCAPITHRYISVCDATREGAIAAGVGRPAQHCTIYSGFDLEPFLSVRDHVTVDEAKLQIGLEPHHHVVGKVARMFPQKGHDHFLSAAERIATSDPDARFLLVGDGILRRDLELQVQRSGLADLFVFAGLVQPSDVPRYMQAMDVVVHTSVREGLARVLPQAMATGKPVVGFALDGTPEAVGHDERGLLATPHDPEDVAAKVVQLLQDPERRERLGYAGRAYAIRTFAVEVMVERINEEYRELARTRLGELGSPRADRGPRRRKIPLDLQ
jgi:glycosyltransferase involved in cell wall biosynthesis